MSEPRDVTSNMPLDDGLERLLREADAGAATPTQEKALAVRVGAEVARRRAERVRRGAGGALVLALAVLGWSLALAVAASDAGPASTTIGDDIASAPEEMSMQFERLTELNARLADLDRRAQLSSSLEGDGYAESPRAAGDWLAESMAQRVEELRAKGDFDGAQRTAARLATLCPDAPASARIRARK